MAGARKPVIVRKFTRDWCAGYAGPEMRRDAAELEILDVSGKVIRIVWPQVKWVCYVRELPTSSTDPANPERLLRKRFSIRPRTPGLLMRLTLTDGEEIEGLVANDLSLVDSAGLMLTPPDTRSNTQRIFVPHTAIQSLVVLSLIGASGRRATGQAREQEPELFPAERD